MLYLAEDKNIRIKLKDEETFHAEEMCRVCDKSIP